MAQAMRIGTIVLARMGSSRLPGKVLLDLGGKAVLDHVVDRLNRVETNSGLVVATSTNPKDDELEAYCQARGIRVFRGCEDNVLDRCIAAAETCGFDAVIRIGADSPLLDAGIISHMLRIFVGLWSRGEGPDIMTNSVERSFPLGLDAEIITTGTLKRVAREIGGLAEEERRLNEQNVVPYIYQHPDDFNIHSYKEIRDTDLSEMRWTLDTPKDLDLIRRIYDALYPAKGYFGMDDVLELLERHPDWHAINAHVTPTTGYWSETESQKYRERYGRDLVKG